MSLSNYYGIATECSPEERNTQLFVIMFYYKENNNRYIVLKLKLYRSLPR